MTRFLTNTGLAAFIALAPAVSQAASAPKLPGRAELVKALSDCRAIADPTERLACFDKAAAALDEAQTKGDVVVVDREQAREVKRQAFGFNLGNALSIFDRPAAKDKDGAKDKERERETDESIVSVAKAVTQTPVGKWIVTLETGAVWRQVDSDTISLDPHPGSKIRIRRASLGSYLMSVDGQSSIRVHRDE
jgi:hypothetical protein